MAGFKSGSQRKFLFAMDKDRLKGMAPIGPTKSSPTTFPTSRPPQMTQPPQAFNLGLPQTIKPYKAPSITPSIKPTSNPGIIPPLPGLPKFGRTKKFFKK